MAQTAQDKDKSAEFKRQFKIRRGDTVYTIPRHVSQSGMFRIIDVVVFKKGRPWYLAGRMAHDWPDYWKHDRKRDGLRIGGCGMDIGFHIVYELSSQLFDGDGYALNHSWL